MKALSNIVAAAILLVLVVSIGGIIITYTTEFFQGETSGITNKTEEVVDCTTAKIGIFNVYLNFEENISKVFIRNNGLINEQIKLATMLNQSSEELPILTQLPVSLPKGEITRIDFNITNFMTQCSDFKELNVIANCKSVSFTGTPIC